MSKQAGYSVQFALEALRMSLRTLILGSILADPKVEPIGDDEPEKSRHLSITGAVHHQSRRGSTVVQEITAECWVQKDGDGWQYCQVQWRGAGYDCQKRFYCDDELTSGIQEIPRHWIFLDRMQSGLVRARMEGGNVDRRDETSVLAPNLAEALGQLILKYPERFGIVLAGNVIECRLKLAAQES